MIYTTDSVEDENDYNKRQLNQSMRRSSNTIRLFLRQLTSYDKETSQIKEVNEDEKESLRKILQGYEGRKLEDKELRIL